MGVGRETVRGQFFDVDGQAFVGFQRSLKGADKAIARELNKEFKKVLATKIQPAAKANASWSSRIPGAIKPQVTQKQMGLRVQGGRAPHGRPYEGLQRGAFGRPTFRHPVFGNRNVWVSQKTRPFLQPAFDEHREEAVAAAEDAVSTAMVTLGWDISRVRR